MAEKEGFTAPPELKAAVLDAYFYRHDDSGRFTSQDVCDNVREMITLTPDEVTAYMSTRGWLPIRDDDRLVWTRKEITSR